ncbi:Aminotransferase class I and II [Butyrivibrio sp. ob235]|uniref:pyridoxal phosphate-dependent aminotransferase n=1 Tax=Butyrivibrio sp. ob235 TaxID=1761780 RepID=UPI0008CFCB65|nr:histidinol-phosphate transaminase [Butyrivibrio sp. ob235]SEK23836.1 Aminotransferase class I and II [Butyrivibrio sp. ob235]
MLHGGEIYDKEIKYDFSVNLNPNPCPDSVRQSLVDAIKQVDQYPDITQREFREKVAEAENKYLAEEASLTRTKNNANNESRNLNISPDMIIGGNGASELILAIIKMLQPKKVLLPIPSFYGYRHALKALNSTENNSENIVNSKDDNTGQATGRIIVDEYLLKPEEQFELKDDFIKNITNDTDAVILANPNNPTGRCVGENILEKIIRKCNETQTNLIVDECFLHLSTGAASAVKYLDRSDNLYIINAYTKLFSIPGVRIGYAISSEQNISRLKQCLPEWNMSIFAQKAGIACTNSLLDTNFEEESKALIKEEREKLIKVFSEKGIRVYPSDTNYLLIKSDNNLYEKLLSKGILIRDCSNFKGLEEGFYRIAIKDSLSNCELMHNCNNCFFS